MTETHPEPEFSRTRSEGYQVNLMARLFARALQAQIKPLGLSTGTFPVLLALWDREGQTQRELVKELGVEQATMANTLARMERDGLITRRAHEADARVQTVWLTDHAKALEKAATEAATGVNDHATAGLTDEERHTFAALMSRVINTLSEG